MEQIEGSETSAFKPQTPGKYPKENILHKEHGESLKSRQNHAVLSGHSHETCVVKLLHPTRNVLKNFKTRLVELKVQFGFS